MLADYFSIGIETRAGTDGKGTAIDEEDAENWEGKGNDAAGDLVVLTSLPLLLEGHEPPLGSQSVAPGALPIFLLRLVRGVDWKHEQPCFEGIATEIARFYASSFHAMQEAVEEPSSIGAEESTAETKGDGDPVDPFAFGAGGLSTWALQHRLYPGLRL